MSNFLQGKLVQTIACFFDIYIIPSLQSLTVLEGKTFIETCEAQFNTETNKHEYIYIINPINADKLTTLYPTNKSQTSGVNPPIKKHIGITVIYIPPPTKEVHNPSTRITISNKHKQCTILKPAKVKHERDNFPIKEILF